MLDYSFNSALDFTRWICSAVPFSRSFFVLFSEEITSNVKKRAANASHHEHGMHSYTHQLTSQAAAI